MIQILAFEETALRNGERVRQAAQIIAHQARTVDPFPLVVVSALTGVTERLCALTRAARSGTSQECARLLETIRQSHREAADVAIHDAERYHLFLPTLEEALLELEHEVMQVQVLPYGTADVAQCTARMTAWGERLAVLLVAAAIVDQGTQATPICEEVLVTAFPWQPEPPSLDELVAAPILMTETRSRARRLLLPLLTTQVVPVVAGTLGRTSHGMITTQGEQGAAATAALLAETLHGAAVEIYTGDAGLLSVDPSLATHACTLPTLSYEEAWQLAAFSDPTSQVLHPRVLLPLSTRAIPLRVRHIDAPEAPGTLISSAPSSALTSALALHRHVALIHIRGRGRGDLSKSLALLLRLVAQTGLAPLMLSISASHTCSFLIEERAAEVVLRVLGESLEAWDVRCQTALAACLCVGNGITRNPLNLAYAMVALADEHVSVHSHGYAELGLVLVVPAADGERALRRLHRDFVLPAVSSNSLSPASHPTRFTCA